MKDFIMGKHAIEELLQHAPKKLVKVYIAQTEEPSSRKEGIILHLQQQKIPFQFVPKQTLTSMVQSDSHQSFVAEIAPRHYLDLSVFLEKVKDQDRCFILIVDSIYDPHNFGAILRSAECFGVDAVIFSKNRGSEVTAVVSKSSVGASELLPLIRVSNLAESIRKLKKEDFWVVVSELSKEAKSLSSFDFPKKSVLVLGSEEKGVQKLLLELADERLYIPMSGKVSSLNVAQAASVFLYAWKATQE
jgi:23S rRNA (guanosine2251-2'-O)-methyltransferase